MSRPVLSEVTEGLRLDSVFQAIPYPLCVFDRHQKLVFLNDALWQLYGYKSCREACLALQRPSQLLDNPEQPDLDRVLSGEKISGVTFDARRRDTGKAFTGIYSAYPVRDVEGTVSHVVITIIDVSAQRAAERALRESEEQLASTNLQLRHANEELEQFAFAVSHDLQEPLSMVVSFVEKLQHKFGGQVDASAKDYLEFIAAGSRRMRDMINGLLAYARAAHEPRQNAPCDSDAALRWAITNLGAAIMDNGAVITHDRLPVVMADFSELMHVFQNLISNAIKFAGGAVVRIHVSVEAVADTWTFCVADNGPGIAAAYHDRIFGAFKRLHGREVPGAGLGLALCRRIMDAHGGRIWVESEIGQGARFYFTLPKTDVARAASARH